MATATLPGYTQTLRTFTTKKDIAQESKTPVQYPFSLQTITLHAHYSTQSRDDKAFAPAFPHD